VPGNRGQKKKKTQKRYEVPVGILSLLLKRGRVSVGRGGEPGLKVIVLGGEKIHLENVSPKFRSRRDKRNHVRGLRGKRGGRRVLGGGGPRARRAVIHFAGGEEKSTKLKREKKSLLGKFVEGGIRETRVPKRGKQGTSREPLHHLKKEGGTEIFWGGKGK